MNSTEIKFFFLLYQEEHISNTYYIGYIIFDHVVINAFQISTVKLPVFPFHILLFVSESLSQAPSSREDKILSSTI